MIKQPSNLSFSTSKGFKIHLKWNSGLSKKWDGNYKKSQEYLDNEVLKGCEPYTPRDSGVLIKSGKINTKIGSGTVEWKTDYARKWYYNNANFKGAPMRGSKWFERAKNSHKKQWIDGIEKIMR